MLNLLIPTDFSIKSLNVISAATQYFDGEKLNITLIHAMEADNTISALLQSRKRALENSLISEVFTDACEILKNKHDSVIEKISITYYYAGSAKYLQSFLNARQTDYIVFAKDYAYHLLSKESLAPREVFKNTKIKILELSCEKIALNGNKKEHSISELLSF